MNRQRRGWTAARVALALAMLAAGTGWANNLTITNVSVSGRDNSTAFVQFDISWENSWRYAGGDDPLYFHDAAWVFFKVQLDGQTAWQHVTLEGTGTNPTEYDTGTGTPIEMVVPSDRVGMFVRRSAAGAGAGTVSVTGVKAVWNFASNGLVKNDKVKVQAFGVEMVYVAEGAFWAGNTNGVINDSFRAQGNEDSPVYIDSENAFTIYWGTGEGSSAAIPADFPKGYAAFYCMKYEITQGQYADFLNALTRAQQEARCTAITLDYYMSHVAGGSSSVQQRNTVRLTGDSGSPAPRVYTTVTPDRACNWLSFADGAAFADWAGLRPMTELEFEKACRGPLEPVANEYAFGAITYTAISGLQGTDGSGTETYTSGNLFVNNVGFMGPLRVGIFAKSGATREQAGASYWGIMELSGNMAERPVTIGNATGRAFTGAHGNGTLTELGNADVANWPAGDTGAGLRGGAWSLSAADARVSDRRLAASGTNGRFQSYANIGWRGVRSAP